MTRIISFRCAGRTAPDAYHTIRLEGRRLTCSCNGVDWCSHIDATLLAGERHMVPLEDRTAADAAMRRMKGILKSPFGWQASWRDDRVWRGLAARRSDDRMKHRLDGRPTVCFIGAGTDGNRAEYVDHASSLGWRVIERPDPYTTLVVLSEDGRATKRASTAIDLDLPTISHKQWSEWIYEFTHAILDRIEEHGFTANDAQHAA